MILIIISFFSIHLTNSRYTSGKKGKGDFEIAKPVIEFKNISSADINNMMPGQTAEYYFNIINVDSESKNEVLINYYIEVSFEDNDLPITYTIYDITNGNEVELETNSNKTSLISLGYKEIETHKYKIEFEWKSEENNISYSNKQTTFNIEVYAEQVIN